MFGSQLAPEKVREQWKREEDEARLYKETARHEWWEQWSWLPLSVGILALMFLVVYLVLQWFC